MVIDHFQTNIPSSRKLKNRRVNRTFDPSKYSTRLIALKFAYFGQSYNGLEYHQNTVTPLPTIEEELWKALNKARLIFPTPDRSIPHGEVNWKGCDFSVCGRTDKGVSAFGQVIGVRVRSFRPLDLPRKDVSSSTAAADDAGDNNSSSTSKISLLPSNLREDEAAVSTAKIPLSEDALPFHPIDDEIPYVQVLNRLLPSDIRVLAWCANPPENFSARFFCKERRYRYFFTQPAFTPTRGPAGIRSNRADPKLSRRLREGWLDIEKMKTAAEKFEGVHDFRNFCKLDPTKQITNFERTISYANIEEVDPGMEYVCLPGFQHYEYSALGSGSSSKVESTDQGIYPKVYTFTLHGSAFLYHQVRHMVAILFLIGQGLESPELISELLNVQKNPQKPVYLMADDAPLVLWECVFPSEGSDPPDRVVKWLYVGDPAGSKNNGGKRDGKYGHGGVVNDIWKVWRQKKIDEILAGTLLNVIVGQGDQDSNVDQPLKQKTKAMANPLSSGKVFLGGSSSHMVGKHTPVLKMQRAERVEVLNARYAKKNGLEPKGGIKSEGVRDDMLTSEALSS